MSDLPPLSGSLPPTNEPLRIAVRRMRWFRAAFEAYIEAVGARIGCTYTIDEAKLDQVAQQAAGSPLFAEELARVIASGKDAATAPTIEAAIQVP